ncbi:hypothetical protein EAH84_02600 [Sphingomonas oligophenolica]|uniref:Lipoprotein n=2 Tax=Sphingomonas oligophenolica TaxID=301154 RepID=A0A502CS73_9SPHN|nr:hypothetical protein EAH84_02600 [Sphingomonas oligophenolica]
MMTRFATLLCTAALFGLAACDSSKAGNAPAPDAASTSNYLDKLESLPGRQRDGVFLRAIRDSGQDCQGVTTSQRTETPDGKPAWTATCTDGTIWILVLGANGVMTVTNAAIAQDARR